MNSFIVLYINIQSKIISRREAPVSLIWTLYYVPLWHLSRIHTRRLSLPRKALSHLALWYQVRRCRQMYGLVHESCQYQPVSKGNCTSGVRLIRLPHTLPQTQWPGQKSPAAIAVPFELPLHSSHCNVKREVTKTRKKTPLCQKLDDINVAPYKNVNQPLTYKINIIRIC